MLEVHLFHYPSSFRVLRALGGKEEVAAVSAKCFKFLGHGVDRGVNLRLAVVGGDEESQASEVVGHGRVQNGLYIDAALEQGA
jgi:hypothetical protein